MHLLDITDLPLDFIFEIGVVWGPNHVNSPKDEVLLQGIVNSISILVKYWVRSDLYFLYLRLLLINELF